MSAAKLLQLNALAGACLGLLIGVLIGLSASQVVGTIVGSLTAIAAAFISFVEPKHTRQEASGDNHATDLLRLIAFCLGCLVGLFGGLFVRTHDWLSPTMADRYNTLTRDPLKFTRAQAQQIIAFQEAGYALGGVSELPIDNKRQKDNNAAPLPTDNVALVHSFLRDSPGSACDELQATRSDPNPVDVKIAFSNRDGDFALAARASDWIPPHDRKRFFNEVLNSLCHQNL